MSGIGRVVPSNVALRLVVVVGLALFFAACTTPGEVTGVPTEAGEAAGTVLAPGAEATDALGLGEPAETEEAGVPGVTEAVETPAVTEETEAVETPEVTEEAETPEVTKEAETPAATDEAASPEATEGAGTAAGMQPASVLAAAGQEVFLAECQECHGPQGEGVTAPALIGDETEIDGFETAQGIFDFISQAMPADAPGTLTDEQYRDVTAFLLLENGWVEDDTELSLETFEEITLE